MSASLVGSEMCIRDRPVISEPALPPPEAYHMNPAASAETRQQVARDTDAVSYTHLTLPTICSV
eukprot:1461523-Alexandrium_andersonii.AAC.1